MEKEFELAILNGTGVPSIDREYAFVRAADAAYAIAEWMRKAVLWEGEATIKHEWRWEDGEHIVTAGLHFDELPPGWMLSVPDGQRVRVVMWLEEGDNDQD